ncbi:hypothetical protein BU26DRAFT_508821 [Trematosphaeria pertusa]|uniref:Mid2 domain-containing protein n=1 Tax=Trematosphaeria pertusa TaxID=390896 RepID=A0A6A6I3F9_9PLEO|nr:uncharacterized protein BU26DRAFT_508821 [Trematosphaeria pertusa]KAF2244851.1 hypothetical protein BU26DRAFT_508821 [Trematosphaeria pertusa]
MSTNDPLYGYLVASTTPSSTTRLAIDTSEVTSDFARTTIFVSLIPVQTLSSTFKTTTAEIFSSSSSTSVPAPTTTPGATHSSSGLDTEVKGAIIGACAGAGVLLGGIIILLLYLRSKRRKSRTGTNGQEQSQGTGPESEEKISYRHVEGVSELESPLYPMHADSGNGPINAVVSELESPLHSPDQGGALQPQAPTELPAIQDSVETEDRAGDKK